MQTTRISLHPDYPIGEVDERIFGGFMEHMGRCVHEGVYQPGSRHADAAGFRQDVLGALDKLKMTAMRYPGGNFASGYHWLDGVGPKDRRPVVRELAWQSLESNQFGTDEYIAMCRRMGWTPMLTVNLGTGSPEEARNWVEYCNCPPDSRYSQMRAANGSPDPYAVKLWCLGNEMDGQWQLGHVPADQYAIRAQQSAKMMKDCDGSLELVVCGSCGTGMPTYMEWDRQVLTYLGDFADYVSLHRYVGNRDNDTPDYLAISNSIDQQIEEMDAACRFVQAQRRSKKRAYLCFDEWNVWYKAMDMNGRGKHAPHLIEEVYNLEDALVVSAFLHSFIRHADVLKIANIAQIVNIIAPLLTRGDDLLVQSIFHVFELFSRRRQGVSMRLAVDGPTYAGKTNGTVHTIDASAIRDGATLQLFLTNRSLDQAGEVKVDFAGVNIAALTEGRIVAGKDPKGANSFERPEVVTSANFAEVVCRDGKATVKLPALSVAALTLKLA